MEVLLGLTGVFASILGLVLAFYAVFVNGKANREMLRDIRAGGERQAQMLKEIQASGERQARILERVEETQRYIAELVRIEGEKTRTLLTR